MDAWELAVQFFNRSDRINSPEAYDIFQKHFLNLTLQLFHDDPVKLKVAKEVFEREMNVSPLRKGVHSTRLNFSLLRVKLALNETDGIRELSSDRSWEKSTQHTRDPETTKAYVVAQARIAADEQDPAVAEEAIQEIHRILKQYPPLGVLGPVWEMEIRREVGAELLKSPLTTYAGLDLME